MYTDQQGAGDVCERRNDSLQAPSDALIYSYRSQEESLIVSWLQETKDRLDQEKVKALIDIEQAKDDMTMTLNAAFGEAKYKIEEKCSEFMEELEIIRKQLELYRSNNDFQMPLLDLLLKQANGEKSANSLLQVTITTPKLALARMTLDSVSFSHQSFTHSLTPQHSESLFRALTSNIATSVSIEKKIKALSLFQTALKGQNVVSKEATEHKLHLLKKRQEKKLIWMLSSSWNEESVRSLIKSYMLKAVKNRERTKFQAALRLYSKALHLLKCRFPISPEVVETYVQIGDVNYLDLDNKEAAESAYFQATEICQSSFPDTESSLELYAKFSRFFRYQRRYTESELWLTEALKIAANFPNSPAAALAYLNQGGSCLLSEKSGKAELWYKKAVEVAKDSPSGAFYYWRLGMFYAGKKRFSEALEAYRTGLEYSPSRVTVNIHIAIGSMFRKEQHRSEQALDAFKTAICIGTERFPHAPETASAYESYARALPISQWEEKLNCGLKANALYIALNPLSENAAINWQVLGSIYINLADQGHIDRGLAETALKQALKISLKHAPDEVAKTNYLLGDLYISLKRFSDAEVSIRACSMSYLPDQSQHASDVIVWIRKLYGG